MDNVEVIYIKKFPTENELYHIPTNTLKDMFFTCIKNEKYYMYKINNTYYGCSSINNLNYETHNEIYILNIPNLYIVDEKLTFIVNIQNISKFKIEKTEINNTIFEIYIYFLDLKNNNHKNCLFILNTFDNINKYIDNYDLILKNNNVNFIGINDNFKIYFNDIDITNTFLQRLFQILKSLYIVEKFYNYSKISIINNNSGVFVNSITIRSIFLENCNNVTIDDIVNIFTLIQNNDKTHYI